MHVMRTATPAFASFIITVFVSILVIVFYLYLYCICMSCRQLPAFYPFIVTVFVFAIVIVFVFTFAIVFVFLSVSVLSLHVMRTATSFCPIHCCNRHRQDAGQTPTVWVQNGTGWIKYGYRMVQGG